MYIHDLEDLYELYLMYRYLTCSTDKTKKKQWVHKINRLRADFGAHARLMPQLKVDSVKFFNYCRMSQDSFKELLAIIKPDLTKSDTNFRRAIDPELKLMLALRFLATGASFQSLHYQFRVGHTTAREAVYDICAAIWRRLGSVEMPLQTTQSLRETANRFLTLWQYPHCIGALDGKHVNIQCPQNSGSEFYSYKGTFSITLQAVSDADGFFSFIDVGDYGRHCDAGVFKYSSFGRALVGNEIPIPSCEGISGSESLPYVFISDEAYPLMKNLMKPFARRDLTDMRRIFNYRHSRARRVVECAFGMMTSKWGALKTTLNISPEHAKTVTLACCVLHNFVRRREGREYTTDFHLPNPVNDESTNVQRIYQGRPANYAVHVRNQFADIMQNEIPLPWQAQSSLT